MIRSWGATVAAAGLILSAACGQPEPSPTPAPEPAIQTFDLPDTVSFPEGIAYDAADDAIYTTSAVDGTLVRIAAGTGAAETVAPAGVLIPAGTTTFPTTVGMKIDADKRLWIAGGRVGTMTIFDTRTRAVVAQVKTPEAPGLVNDVILIGNAGYFTDTFVPTLWRVTLNGTAATLEPWLDLRGTPIEYTDGPSLNGIVATPDGRTLIVGQMNKGLLFRIDVETKAVTPIDTGGADLTGIDGLVLDGSRLYVVRQTAVEVAAVDLAPDLSSGKVAARLTESLAWPATGARVGDDLVVVNSQFNVRQAQQETRPFTLSRIPVARFGAS